MSTKCTTYQNAIKELKRYESALERKDRRHGCVFYSNLDTTERLGEEMLPDTDSLSIEELVEQQEEVFQRMQGLQVALTLLPVSDYLLVKEIFYEGVSQREYAKKLRIPQRTLNKRVSTILKKLRCFTLLAKSLCSPPSKMS